MRRRFVWLLLAGLLTLLGLWGPAPALAHDFRKVGKYEFTVGWLTEPTLAGERNGLDLKVVNGETNQPVEGLISTLKVELSFGSQTRALTLRIRPGLPGYYTADVIPTQPGAYTFHFFGLVESQAVDERFESGPNRFDDVAPASTLEFPPVGGSGVPAATAAPATALATSGVAATQPAPPTTIAAPPTASALGANPGTAASDDRVRAAEDKARAAQADADTARWLALGGLAVGAPSLVGVVFLMVQRARSWITSPP